MCIDPLCQHGGRGVDVDHPYVADHEQEDLGTHGLGGSGDGHVESGQAVQLLFPVDGVPLIEQIFVQFGLHLESVGDFVEFFRCESFGFRVVFQIVVVGHKFEDEIME